ncbi:MAG: cytochrome P450 [Saprospiraceae bacterium]|nr:MAG: cytochrome P450 [Saprospiraceae bacterium]
MLTNIPVYRGRNILMPGAEFLANPYRFTTTTGRQLGRLYNIPFLFRRIFVISDLDAIAHVLQRNPRNYVKSPAYRQLRLALGNGLVTNEGESWFRQRRLIQPAFHKTRLQTLFADMGRAAEDYCRRLQTKACPDEPIDVAVEMMEATAGIVLRTLFSTDNPADIAEMYRIMTEAQEYIIQRTVRPYLIPWYHLSGRHRRFRRDMRWFDEQLFQLVEQRRRLPERDRPHDLLTLLLESRYEDTGQPMDDQQLRDEAVTLFAAGHETSANGLTWTLYLLSQHPREVQKLRAEVDAVLADRTPSWEDLERLQYTKQVVQEGLRLFPPAYAVGREPIQDDLILGHRIPAGSVVFIAIAAVHRDPAWYERPDAFYPDHFLPEVEKHRPRLAWMPFGAGPRFCIGAQFALMEMQLLLAMLIRRFDFELVPGHPVEPEPLITLKPRFGMRMYVRPRRS